MNRIVRISATIAVILGASVLVVAGANAAPLLMTIDHDASSLTLDGQLSGFTFLEQAPGSKTTKYTGTITVDVDSLLAPSMISIQSATADADVNGVWLPKLGGSTGPTDADPFPAAAADYGVKAQIFGQDGAFAAARGLVFDISSESENVEGGGLFDSTETLTVLSGLFDSWISPQIGGGGGQDNTAGDIYPRDATMPTQSSYVVVGNMATLTIPVRVRRADDTDFTSFTGTLVATATIPEPSTFVLIGTAIAGAFVVRRQK